MRYPWTVSQWQQLVLRLTEQRLPHAMLFSGIEGLGKIEVAIDFARSLLCQQPTDDFMACNLCRSCTQLDAGSHPDFHLITPEEAGKPVRIDQIRALIEQFQLASHHGGYRVAIINPADAMNLAAANSLLKCLEEPPENSLIILVSSNPAALPATILSRCQQINFAVPGIEMAKNWLNKQQFDCKGQENALLAMSNGAPLKALMNADAEEISRRDAVFEQFKSIALDADSAFINSSEWLKSGLGTPIKWVYSWVSDIIKLKSQFGGAIINHDKTADLQKIAQQVELNGLYLYMDALLATLKRQRAPLNAEMILDDLLLDWQSLTSITER